MKYAGPIIGMPFSWEGTAFFLEAIFLGLFLYGWNRVPPWWHWACGVLVGVFGFASGIFVLAANSWMNTPAGFTLNPDGTAINIDPIAAMFNKAWFHQSLHMQLAALQAVGLAVAGIHAGLLLRGRRPALNLNAVRIAMAMGGTAALIQPLSGHFAAQRVAELQPAKLAAMEGLYETERGADLKIMGVRFPKLLSFLATNDFNGEVKGLDQLPEDLHPPVPVVRVAFQVMVVLGTLMALFSLVYFVSSFRKKIPIWALSGILFLTPMGFIALEAGWVVTEVGRQPWIIYGVLKTKDALTPMPGVGFHFALFLVVYLILAFLSAFLLARQIRATQFEGDS
jgi:cytochrome d ubiquinol oxidase subunit I